MNKFMRIMGLTVIVVVLAIPLGARVLAENPVSSPQVDAQGSVSSQPNQSGTGTDSNPNGAAGTDAQGTSPQAGVGTDSNPVGKPEVVIPEEYRPQAGTLASPTAANATPVYFTPQDENTSTTVLFLYNTTNTAANVSLETYYIDGTLSVTTTIAVPANGLVRICADTVTTVSASWASYVLVNFTTFSAYAKMMVPAGVKVDGYVAWNTTGVYDPLTSLQTLPLRFSGDPLALYVPLVSR